MYSVDLGAICWTTVDDDWLLTACLGISGNWSFSFQVKRSIKRVNKILAYVSFAVLSLAG